MSITLIVIRDGVCVAVCAAIITRGDREGDRGDSERERNTTYNFSFFTVSQLENIGVALSTVAA